ncbi:MAG: malto-oligosyltrehalose trehalohydrolase [Planctomycetia bacterium]|nr:malto-oligosyltrehalose trehalohydrolase [Planctomycetia bacterium]
MHAAATTSRQCGALPQADGSIRWRVWAPRANTVELVLLDGDRRRRLPMTAEPRGFFQTSAADVPDGQRYAFSLKGGPERPDPCSLWQPDGVHAPSAVVRPGRFAWTDAGWKGVPRDRLAFYELHVGTFTPEGTFDAIIPRLAALRELGVTALELMPVGQFPGTRNWGYDGVSLYAVQHSYGGPQGLQRLVAACHAAGLAVFLDVVYNHLGPEGNYLNEFAPYFTDHYRTPWGPAVNYDGAGSDPVRAFVLDNARMWLEEFHLDGLRLDAVHAIYDSGAKHILRELQETAEDVAARSGRKIQLIAESDLNDPRMLLPAEQGGHGLDGQWADDFHHTVHALLTGEVNGYYADFGEAEQLAQTLRCPFLYAGNYSRHRDRKHGAPPPAELTGERFVVCLQNHDQVGNRARGERLATLLPSPAARRLAASLLLLSPYTPLLFMGEEYGETNPFPFFCSFGDAPLIQAVREGRKKEFAAFAFQGEVPDPHGEATFASARLSWSWPEGSAAAGLRQLHVDLLAARRTWPALQDFVQRTARWQSGSVLELMRGTEPHALRALFNLTATAQPCAAGGRVLFSSEAVRYAGARPEGGALTELLPYECLVCGVATG